MIVLGKNNFFLDYWIMMKYIGGGKYTVSVKVCSIPSISYFKTSIKLPLSIFPFSFWALKTRKSTILGKYVILHNIHCIDYMLQFFVNYILMPHTLKNHRMLLMREIKSFIGFFCGSYETAPFTRRKKQRILKRNYL